MKYMGTVNFALPGSGMLSKLIGGMKGKASKAINYFPEIREIAGKPTVLAKVPPTQNTSNSLADNVINRSGTSNTYPMKRGQDYGGLSSSNMLNKSGSTSTSPYRSKMSPLGQDNMANRTGTTKTYKTRQYIY